MLLHGKPELDANAGGQSSVGVLLFVIIVILIMVFGSIVATIDGAMRTLAYRRPTQAQLRVALLVMMVVVVVLNLLGRVLGVSAHGRRGDRATGTNVSWTRAEQSVQSLRLAIRLAGLTSASGESAIAWAQEWLVLRI